MLNINSKTQQKKQLLITGGDYISGYQTIWAQGPTYFAVKSSSNHLKLFDYNFKINKTYNLEDRILHVFHILKDSFLIFCTNEVYRITSDLKLYLIDFDLEKNLNILSGAVLDESHFFIHHKTQENSLKCSIFNFDGELVNQCASNISEM